MSFVSGTSSINNSLIENAFVDDSDDISSDETLFSISPNGFEHLDSASETPLPTIVSPIHTSIVDNLAFKAAQTEDSNGLKTIVEDSDADGQLTPVNNSKDYRQPQVTFKIIVSPLKIMKSSQQLQSITVTTQPASVLAPSTQTQIQTQTQTQTQAQVQPQTQTKSFVVVKTPLPPNTNMEDSEASATETKVTHLHQCQCGQVKMTQQEILNTSKKDINPVNPATINPKMSSLTIAFNEQAISKSNFDMKSQMAKYNEYLHYLRYGFPKRK